MVIPFFKTFQEIDLYLNTANRILLTKFELETLETVNKSACNLFSIIDVESFLIICAKEFQEILKKEKNNLHTLYRGTPHNSILFILRFINEKFKIENNGIKIQIQKESNDPENLLFAIVIKNLVLCLERLQLVELVQNEIQELLSKDLSKIKEIVKIIEKHL